MAIPQPSKPGKPDNTPPAKLSKTEEPGKKLYAWLEKKIAKAGTDKREADGLKLIGQYVFGNPQIELADLSKDIIQAAQAAFLLLESSLKPIAKPYLPAELLPPGEAPTAQAKTAPPKNQKTTEEDEEETTAEDREDEQPAAKTAKPNKSKKAPDEEEEDETEEDEEETPESPPAKATKPNKSKKTPVEDDSEEEDDRPAKSAKDSAPVMVPVPVAADKSGRLSDEDVQKQFEVVTDDKPELQPVGRKLVTTTSTSRRRGPTWVVPVVILVLGGGALAGGIYLADKYLSSQHSNTQAKGPAQDTPTVPNPPPRTSTTPTPKPPPKKIDVTPTSTPEPTPDPKNPGPMNPLPIPSDRKAAEKLIPFAELTLKLATGETVTVKKDGALPPGDFVVTQILVLGDKFPPEFVSDVLFPALAELRSLTHLNARFGTNLKLSDDQVVQLGKLPLTTTLTSLVARFELTPRTLDALSRITNLNELTCDAPNSDDALLKRLTELPKLVSLNLGVLGKSGMVSVAGFTEVVAKLPVVALGMDQCPVVDRAFLQKLPSMPKVRHVNFYGCNIGNDDLKEFTHCPDLLIVGLGGTKLTDAGLVHLAKMPKLLVLMLINTGITDKGLDRLTKMTGLRHLQLNGCKGVTKVGVEKLAKALPQCKIEWDGGVSEPKDADRIAAEKLNPFADLKLRLTSGKEETVKRSEALPPETFVVTEIVFANNKLPNRFTNEVFLPAVAELKSLTTIRAWGDLTFQLTEDQLAKLAALPLAKSLTTITYNAGANGLELNHRTFDMLKRFEKLNNLACSAASANDALLERLSELPAIKSAALGLHSLGHSEKVTKRGLDAVAKLPLRDLALAGSPVAGEFIQRLPGVCKIHSLNFWSAPLTDVDLKELAKYSELGSVRLDDTNITDAGLKHLEGMIGLRFVSLTQTKVSKGAAEELKKKLPLCKIIGPDDKEIGLPKK